MPKVPTIIRRRFVSPASPVIPEHKLHDIFGNLLDVVEVETEQDPDLIKDDHSQTSSTRRKRSMIIDLLRLGRKTKNDTSPSATQTKKKFLTDLLKLGRSDKLKKADNASSSSGSDIYDSDSGDEENAGSSSSQEKDAVEEPEVPAPTLDLPSVPYVESTSTDAVAQAATREEVETEMEEKEVVTLVDVDDDDQISKVHRKSPSEEGPSGTEKPVSKESGSTDGHSAAAATTIVTSATDSDSALVSASSSSPTPASIAASAPVSPLPALHTVDPSNTGSLPSESTTPSYPFNHFPSAPRRPESTRRGLRREHGFYHKSHFEIAWVPEFGDRDAPPQTLEEVLPPWDPLFRPENEGGSPLSAMPFLASLRPRGDATIPTATAAARTLPVESTSVPVAVSRADESVMPSVGAISSRTRSRRGTTLKRAREPEPENTEPSAEEGRPVRRRRVGLNKAVGA